jgi:hypothetical protein
MEALASSSIDVQIPHLAFTTLLKYVDLTDIATKLAFLSKSTREWMKAENYILFKHFIRYYNMHDRHKRCDIPAKTDVYKMIIENGLICSSKTSAEALVPFCFGTDGGTYNDEMTYFIHKMFS